MAWSEIDIRKTEQSGFEAELRWDRLISGDRGCWVSVIGWGVTEQKSREGLATALDSLQIKAPEAD